MARSAHPAMLHGPAERDAVAAVELLRAALRRADVDSVQSVRWLAPRPPGERDLLSDLAAAEGLDPAIRRLSRFWRRAGARLERVRTIGALEAEIYERLSLPGESLPIVTLVRRTAADAPWRVVCTNEAYDERFTLWVPSPPDTIDDVAWSRAFASRFGGGELVMDGTAGVLGAPEQGWLAHVRGPFRPRSWPEGLSGDEHLVELTAALVPDVEARRAQVLWMMQAVAVFVEQLGACGAYLPSHAKLLHREALAAATSRELRPDESARLFACRAVVDGYVLTSGLRLLGLPEVEAPVALAGHPRSTDQLVGWAASKLVELGAADALFGTDLVLGQRTFRAIEGRRGPRRGRSHGRFGAIGLIEDAREARGSRTRLRLPEHTL